MPKCQVFENKPLAPLTTFNVGGPARYLFMPTSMAHFQMILANLDHSLPLKVLGLGSNVLVSDAGFPGNVIVTSRFEEDFSVNLDEGLVYVGAGYSVSKLARETAKVGLTGLEFLYGIPGTVGGALCMNAGAYGHSTWDFVESTWLIDDYGTRFIAAPANFEISYRHVVRPDNTFFAGAVFKLAKGDATESFRKMHHLLLKRQASQPYGSKTAGSVFKNPQGDFAARLIEESGLKGYQHGGACISVKHANFIVNEKDACAQDIKTLITYAQEKVFECFGIKLEPEVEFVGFSV